MQRRNFDRHGVPGEVSAEFLRLSRLSGKEVAELKRGMFQEQRLALQCYREAMTSVDQVKANQHLTQAQQHEAKSKQLEARMIYAEMKEFYGVDPRGWVG